MSLRSVVAVCLLTVACGKSGPPLPPLLKLPAAPANIVAERRGTAVDVEFTVPVANTDGTRPANVERVDVYAITGPETMTDDQIVKHGLKVATVSVKAPRDPDQAAEPDDPDAIVDHANRSHGAYLAHEYLNEYWNALYHADVARDLSAAKLEFVGSAGFLRNVPDFRGSRSLAGPLWSGLPSPSGLSVWASGRTTCSPSA